MGTEVVGGSSYRNLSSSALIKSGAGDLIGVFCASSSSGTLKLWDAASATTPVLVNTFSLSAGTWYPLPFHFGIGLYATIGGTADITISYS